MNRDDMTPIERRLAPLWMNVLHVDALDVLSSFADLGGDLQAATLVLDEIGSVFNVRLNARLLFEKTATLRRIASIIEGELDAGPLSN